MFKKLILPLVAGLMIFSSCGDDEDRNEDLVSSVQKDGAIESTIATRHLSDSQDILVTKHIVWRNNIMERVIERQDTIPSLSNTVVYADNEKGVSTSQITKKDYEVFITVK